MRLGLFGLKIALVCLSATGAQPKGRQAAWQRGGPAPGCWTIHPSVLISGKRTRLELRYVNGPRDLPPRATMRFHIEPLSVSALEHTPISRALKAAQSFSLVYGNAQTNGDVIAIVNPVPVHGLSFNVHGDLEGKGKELDWFEMGWWRHLPRVSIEGVDRGGCHAPSLPAR